MNCVVTAGPTFEPIDEVRRLTNLSTGRLGTELANYLSDKGHQVTLFIGQQSTYRSERHPEKTYTFTTTASLRERLKSMASQPVDAVFHAAAVSDFAPGKIWTRTEDNELVAVHSGKISSRLGPLLLELVPTPKIISEMRDWFPKARLIGWKYEVDGDRHHVIHLAEQQIAASQSDACVANGRAYGEGFGLVTGKGKHTHLDTLELLFESLEKLISR